MKTDRFLRFSNIWDFRVRFGSYCLFQIEIPLTIIALFKRLNGFGSIRFHLKFNQVSSLCFTLITSKLNLKITEENVESHCHERHLTLIKHTSLLIRQIPRHEFDRHVIGQRRGAGPTGEHQ